MNRNAYRWLVFACLAFAVASFASVGAGTRSFAQDKPPFDPTENYADHQIEGWHVLVNRSFAKDDAALCERTLELLRFQLYQITRVVPAGALEKLRTVRIWVEKAEPHHPCMAYHPNPGWLREHDMNPEKARCVEVANAENFLKWTREQPWMVLHELAHAYHHQFLDGGFDNTELKAAYETAMKENRYAEVLRINGATVKHYAVTNPMEYFAEASEAYFGTNDFYPFVRAELKAHDRRAFKLLEDLWGVRSNEPANEAALRAERK